MQILLSTKSYFRQSRGSNSEMLKQLGKMEYKQIFFFFSMHKMHLFCDDSKHLRILVLRDSNMQKDKDMKCVISLNRYCSFNTLILVRNRVRDSVKVIFIDHLE